jgi:ATPase family associated with various cellular activities (AAA)/Winged helix domain, variant
MNAALRQPQVTPAAEETDGLPIATWNETNRRWLVSELRRLGSRLDALAGDTTPAPDDDGLLQSGPGEPLPALLHLADAFGLTGFECELLLLCAGVELDAALRQSVQRAQTALLGVAPPGSSPFATFGLAMQALSSPHWDAVSPERPLRRWRLIHVPPEWPLLDAPLRIDERVLHHVCGLPATDERLEGIVRYLGPSLGLPRPNARSHRIARWLTQAQPRTPLAVIEGELGQMSEVREEALCALGECGRHALWLSAQDLPDDARALARLAQALDRETILTPGWPVIALEGAGDAAEALERRTTRLLAHLGSPAIVIGALGVAACAALPTRRVRRLPRERGPADAPEHPGIAAMDPGLGAAVRTALQQFDLGPGALEIAIDHAEAADGGPHDLADRVWQACREQARGGLEALAQRVGGNAGFDDLVLPAAHLRILRGIAEHLRQRDRVYRDWGMGGKSERGLGLCALFAGESGTGKTLAAEAIANEARLDLYRVDLATLVSKYIGETEKNLKRLFDAAHTSGAVLLFDEADALFGKRSEVKDSHDRYANVEIAYLLQSIEAYRGLAILTTNLKSAIDRAFLRRIRYVVQFPFPDATARERIWRAQFPATAPMDGVDFAALARAMLSGGNIRNVALNAAFRAASGDRRITHDLVVGALRDELTKLERGLGTTQLGAGP